MWTWLVANAEAVAVIVTVLIAFITGSSYIMVRWIEVRQKRAETVLKRLELHSVVVTRLVAAMGEKREPEPVIYVIANQLKAFPEFGNVSAAIVLAINQGLPDNADGRDPIGIELQILSYELGRLQQSTIRKRIASRISSRWRGMRERRRRKKAKQRREKAQRVKDYTGKCW